LRKRCAGIGRFVNQAKKDRVIGNRVKIQGLCQLYFKATGVLDRLALGVAIGVGR
jgi:hypothetical protein